MTYGVDAYNIQSCVSVIILDPVLFFPLFLSFTPVFGFFSFLFSIPSFPYFFLLFFFPLPAYKMGLVPTSAAHLLRHFVEPCFPPFPPTMTTAVIDRYKIIKREERKNKKEKKDSIKHNHSHTTLNIIGTNPVRYFARRQQEILLSPALPSSSDVAMI